MLKKILIAGLVIMLGTSMFAGDAKIAVIDMDKIFQNYYKTKVADAALKQQAEIYRAWIHKLKESMLKLQEEFNILRDASQNIAFSASEREKKRMEAQKKYRQISKKKAELQQYTAEKTKQYKQLETRKRREILLEIKSEVKRRATLQGYTLVLDLSGKTLNDIPAVIYHNPASDITADVLKTLNRGYKQETSEQETSNAK
jgi:outer membrane protein